MPSVLMYFDGACLPRNPGGHAAWGVWIEGLEPDGVGLCGYVGHGNGITNNVAEYTALISGLEYLLRQEVRSCEVRGDSELAIKQMNGEYRVKAPNIIPLWTTATALGRQLARVSFRWVPRKQNSQADLWSRFGLYYSVEDRARDVLANYDIWFEAGAYHMRGLGKDRVWTVSPQKDGRFRCDCPAFQRSSIDVCKHAAAAWLLVGERKKTEKKRCVV